MPNEKRYLVVDSHQCALAHAVLESETDAPDWQIRVLDGEIDKVMEHRMIQLISMTEDTPSPVGKITLRRGDRLMLERQGDLGSGARENFRIPVNFQSYIYPGTGSWRGRREIMGNDISCGGTAFFSAFPLALGEQVEIVIPVTSQPVILMAEVLRKPLADRYATLYAAKFINLIYDQEIILRESVYSIQLHRRSNKKGATRS